MSTAAHALEDPADEKHGGTFRFTPEDEEEMVEILAELDEDDRAGRLKPIEQLFTKPDRSSCGR